MMNVWKTNTETLKIILHNSIEADTYYKMIKSEKNTLSMTFLNVLSKPALLHENEGCIIRQNDIIRIKT